MYAEIDAFVLYFSALKRADSSASGGGNKQKMSSISASEASDHDAIEGVSPGAEDSPGVFQVQN